MKKMLSILILTMLVLVSGCDMAQDIYDFEQDGWWMITRVTGHELIDHPEWDALTNRSDIVYWIRDHVEYKTDDTDVWNDPAKTLQDGYGDCEDYAILYMNMAYVVMGTKCPLLIVDVPEVYTRSVVEGGDINHAMVLDDGEYLDVQSGGVFTFKIGFKYTFDEVFTELWQE